ncbi:MAG: MmgE/PrpD family protein [Pikeienuella sp.]
MATAPVDFLHDVTFGDIPAEPLVGAHRSILDLIGVAAAGSQTALSRIIRDHAAGHFGAGGASAPMIFDGRAVSPQGAALAGGMTIDSIDAHDGYKPAKGHIGCGVLPALLAFAAAEGVTDGQEFIASFVVGYEMAARLSVALHGTVSDYHTSGAWIAVACAGIGSRIMGLDALQTRHAMGIAEYHGPRSQMMRCIDHPTMLKDGSGWGAMAGVSAAYLARDGFTGAPALTVEYAPEYWKDLGNNWLTHVQYFKPSPVCRWAQPPTEAVRTLRAEHSLTSEMVERIEVSTFHEAVRLATRRPETTEQAQYSLPYPVAAAMVRGQVGPAEVAPEAFDDPEIQRLADGMELIESGAFNEPFPLHRIAEVTLVLKSGERISSGPTEARGDPEDPLLMEELEQKYHAYADPVLGSARAGRVQNAVKELFQGGSVEQLAAELGALAKVQTG